MLNAPQAEGRETEPATSGPQPLQMTLQREKLRAVSCDQLAKHQIKTRLLNLRFKSHKETRPGWSGVFLVAASKPGS